MNIQQSKDEQVENGSNPLFTSSEYYFLTFQIITLFPSIVWHMVVGA